MKSNSGCFNCSKKGCTKKGCTKKGGWRFCAALFIGSGLCVGSSFAAAEAFTPQGETVLIQQGFYSSAQQNPLARAKAFVKRAQQEQKPEFYSYAKQAIKHQWQNQNASLEFRLVRAAINQHYHDFAEALSDLDFILAQNPNQAQAHLMRFSVLLVMGDLETARSQCQKMLLAVDSALVVNCLAQVDGVRGKAKQFEETLTSLTAEPNHEIVQEQLLISLFELSLTQGDSAKAQKHLNAVLRLSPNNRYVVEQYNQMLWLQEDYQTLLDATQRALTFEEKVYYLAAAKRLGVFSHRETRLKRALALDVQRNSDNHKYIALYYAYVERHEENALMYAKRNWALQKTVSDALVLLSVSKEVHADDEMDPIRHWVEANGIQDKRLQPFIDSVAEATVVHQAATPNTTHVRNTL